ncbi:TNF receptor-associated factor 3 [Protopterus annectens]|uniref:TNF receptor-associated factor 3 n=1 Tax=Protopterus annectens TaxID=7888 RepID=UPI001CFA8EA8|nr:TNF receptor-associated factor 3 [Protopterus annectens]
MDPSRRVEAPVSFQALQQRHNPDCNISPMVIPVLEGYTEHFVKPLEDKYKCEKCHLALCNPKQTECGHRFCETCMQTLLSSPNPLCTACKDVIHMGKVFNDNCCKREILGLMIYCRNETKGCKEQMTLRNQYEHLKSDCQYEELPCPRVECKEKVLRKDLSDHMEKMCKYRDAKCKYCKGIVPMAEIKKHEEIDCTSVLVTCPFQCSIKTILRGELNAHILECSNAPSACSFQRYGCSFKGNKHQIMLHESNSAALHLNIMKNMHDALEAKIMALENEVREKNRTEQVLQRQIHSLEKDIGRCHEQLLNMETRVLQAQKLIAELTAGKLKEVEKTSQELQQYREEVDTLKTTIDSLATKLTEIESMHTNAGSGSKSATALETELKRHDQMLSVHDIRLADMDLRFQVLETASYNGTLIWKIRDYKRRKQEAVSGKTLSLYSQPFYTSYFGYKMCARVYLNGDGMGRGTHLSLFFVVMRGEYDALLPWPFKQKVTLMLMDQGSTRRHLGDAFKPDPNSSSFKRPSGEMNIASGCPLFVAQTQLEGGPGTYIKDDTIFIKVTVDTSDMPDP